MLLDIQSIPDLRPNQTPAPDINSIRCPNFESSGKRSLLLDRSHRIDLPPPPKQYETGPITPLNGYSGSTTHDSFFETSFGTSGDEVPYHARMNSKPFSYGAVTSSPLLSRHKSPSESIETHHNKPPSPSLHRRNSREKIGTSRQGLESPRLIRRMSGSTGGSVGDGMRHSASRSPSPDTGSRGGTLKRERSNTLTTKIMSRDPSPPSTLGRSGFSRSTSRLDDTVDSHFSDTLNRSFSSTGSHNMTWLQMQQKKLQDRRDARIRAERGPFESRMLSELRTRMQGREFEDGYISDTTMFSETSRDSSPLKNLVPLTINTSASTPQKPPISHSTPTRGNSAPSSPILPQRATTSRFMQQSHTMKNVSRKHSDVTYDRERPFVAVKRAHDHARGVDITDPSSALSQLQSSPLGHINYSTYNTSNQSDGLLTTIHQGGDDSAWQSDSDLIGTNRPITPGFPPSTPTTPYLNQGLPPKSPTAQRKDFGGIRTPSPATAQIGRHEMNGHSSPAPSLYHGQSRRSSLTSLNETTEVISSHPKFVKDISKYWYKPNISRDEAINVLKDKPPGTFIVRDSNSFPGAFGLALKVSSPPPNVTSKSSDPMNELVRHFLIEPTSRGVRLKGCANEPVFGSLSALVYQHSITGLALPCRLLLPDRDPMLNSRDSIDGGVNGSSKGENAQLLLQGAACSVLYLFSADTESLTGPQAIKRAVQLMLASRSTPAVIHFKVSMQGITLTDNSRQLFFRRHYPINTVSHCGLDPDDRRWAQKNEEGMPIGSLRIFGFVAKKGASKSENQCHVLAELEPEQPATAICNFVTKVMMTSVSSSNLV